MGHSEMLLAVAGLDKSRIQELTRQLADGDWSKFPPAEALAFSLAYKLTKHPQDVADEDVRELVAVFGKERAVDVIWYIAWCNYMTRVADAFQLPLEEENVFAEPEKKPDETDARVENGTEKQ
jgi:alkylhydroperoxidase family enzyme